MKKQVNKDHYSFSNYLSKQRWISYWHQLDEIIKLQPDTVLEIGVGAGVFKNIAGIFDINVETVDIDPDLKPDHVASVFELPFKNNSYDVVAAFQVLEHISYENLEKAVGEIKRVAKRYIVISLPDAKPRWHYSFYIPKFGVKNFYINRPTFGIVKHIFDGEHYWEINKKGYSLKSFLKLMHKLGLELITTYRVPEFTYHRFFVLRINKLNISDDCDVK